MQFELCHPDQRFRHHHNAHPLLLQATHPGSHGTALLLHRLLLLLNGCVLLCGRGSRLRCHRLCCCRLRSPANCCRHELKRLYGLVRALQLPLAVLQLPLAVLQLVVQLAAARAEALRVQDRGRPAGMAGRRVGRWEGNTHSSWQTHWCSRNPCVALSSSLRLTHPTQQCAAVRAACKRQRRRRCTGTSCWRHCC